MCIPCPAFLFLFKYVQKLKTSTSTYMRLCHYNLFMPECILNKFDPSFFHAPNIRYTLGTQVQQKMTDYSGSQNDFDIINAIFVSSPK